MKKEEQREKTVKVIDAVLETLQNHSEDFKASAEKTECMIFISNIQNGEDEDGADMQCRSAFQGSTYAMTEAIRGICQRPGNPLMDIIKRVVMEEVMGDILKH